MGVRFDRGLAAAAEGDTETQILIGVAALAIFKVGHARQAAPAA
jgi:hypothetical protein